MIIRSWRAVAGSDEVLQAYADHLKRTTFVEMAQLPGHLGATLAVKVNSDENEPWILPVTLNKVILMMLW